MAISEEERERRRQRAKELVKAGKIGGPRPGSGRPRKKRASELVAERAADEAELIVSAFKDTLEDPNTNHRDKVAAAKEWLSIELKEEEIARKEERELESMKKDELIAELASFLVDNRDVIDISPDDVEEIEDIDEARAA